MSLTVFAGILWIEAMLWFMACTFHYSQVPDPRHDQYLSAPTYARRLLGDLRRDGSLSLRGAIIQSGCCTGLIAAIILVVQPALSCQVAVLIILLQLLATGLLIFASIVLPQVRKQDQ